MVGLIDTMSYMVRSFGLNTEPLKAELLKMEEVAELFRLYIR